MIPAETLADIKRAADLPMLVEQSGVPLRRQHGSKVGWCPFCTRPKTAALTIYPDHYYCFRCKASGSAIDWLMKHDGYTFKDAVQWLADLTGIVIGHTAKPNPELKARAAEDAAKCRWWWRRREEKLRAHLDDALRYGPPEPGSEADEWAECCGRMVRAAAAFSMADRRRIYFEEVRGSDQQAYRKDAANPAPDFRADVLAYTEYLYRRNIEHSEANGKWKDPDGFKDRFGPAALKRAIDTAPWIPNFTGPESRGMVLAFDADEPGIIAALKHAGSLFDQGISFRIPDYAGAA